MQLKNHRMIFVRIYIARIANICNILEQLAIIEKYRGFISEPGNRRIKHFTWLQSNVIGQWLSDTLFLNRVFLNTYINSVFRVI
jgi:hypothetical protein